MKTSRKVIAIVGPTASGKTAVGVKLAKKFDGEIVSADSRQIFRGLDLGTGKEGVPVHSTGISNSKFLISNKNPKSKIENCELKIENLRRSIRRIDEVDQWMIDIVEPGEEFNLFKYTELATKVIEDILKRGKLPIIVGGSGLYVQALIEGFVLEKSEIRNPKSEINSEQSGVIPDLIRDPVTICIDSGSQATVRNDECSREQSDKKTVEELQEILLEIDKKSYDELADKKNPHRLIRAIERAQEGLVVSKKEPDWEVLQIGLEWPREKLNERIDKRVDDRFEEGMLEEVEGLLRSGVSSDWLISLGLEYRIITQHILDRHPEFISGSSGNGMLKQDTDPVSSTGRLASVQHDDKEFEEMKDLLKLRSHQYAKRQMTWFKRFPEIKWKSDYKDIERETGDFLKS